MGRWRDSTDATLLRCATGCSTQGLGHGMAGHDASLSSLLSPSPRDTQPWRRALFLWTTTMASSLILVDNDPWASGEM
jgi:hypothetical protein